jgi:hypothetical protein
MFAWQQTQLLNILRHRTGEDERGSTLVFTLESKFPGNRITAFVQGEQINNVYTLQKKIL